MYRQNAAESGESPRGPRKREGRLTRNFYSHNLFESISFLSEQDVTAMSIIHICTKNFSPCIINPYVFIEKNLPNSFRFFHFFDVDDRLLSLLSLHTPPVSA